MMSSMSTELNPPLCARCPAVQGGLGQSYLLQRYSMAQLARIWFGSGSEQASSLLQVTAKGAVCHWPAPRFCGTQQPARASYFWNQQFKLCNAWRKAISRLAKL